LRFNIILVSMFRNSNRLTFHAVWTKIMCKGFDNSCNISQFFYLYWPHNDIWRRLSVTKLLYKHYLRFTPTLRNGSKGHVIVLKAYHQSRVTETG